VASSLIKRHLDKFGVFRELLNPNSAPASSGLLYAAHPNGFSGGGEGGRKEDVDRGVIYVNLIDGIVGFG